MAHDSQNLQIQITTKAELSGAKALESQLESSIGKAKALGDVKEVDRLTGQLTQVRGALKSAADGSEELRKAMEGEAAATKFLEENHHELRAGLSELGNEVVPGVGRALGDLMKGPIGPGILLISVVGAIKDRVLEWNEALNKMAENASQANFSEGIEAARKAIEDGQASMQAYAATIAQIARDEETVAAALDRQLNLMREIAAAREAMRKADQDAARADIERQAAQHLITEEQAALQEVGRQINVAKGEAASKRQEEDDELQKKIEARDKAAANQPALDADEKTKQQKYSQELARQQYLEKTFGGEGDDWTKKRDQAMIDAGVDTEDRQKARAGTGKSAVDEAQENYEEKQQEYQQALISGTQESVENFKRAMDEAQTAFEKTQAVSGDIDQGRAQYLRTRNPDAQKSLAADKNAADEAAKRGTANQTDVTKLTDEIATTQATMQATRQLQDQELAARIQTILEQAVTKISSMPRGAEVNAGIGVAEAIEQGKNVTDQAGTYLMKLVQALGGHANNLKEAADYMEQFRDDQAKFLDAVTKLTGQGFQLQQQQLDRLATVIEAVQTAARKAQEGADNH